MQGESQETSARVRHVPIKVESRNYYASHQGQNDTNCNFKQEKSYQPKFDQGIRPNRDDKHETTNVNIDYKPKPPIRNTTDQTSAPLNKLDRDFERSIHNRHTGPQIVKDSHPQENNSFNKTNHHQQASKHQHTTNIKLNQNTPDVDSTKKSRSNQLDNISVTQTVSNEPIPMPPPPVDEMELANTPSPDNYTKPKLPAKMNQDQQGVEISQAQNQIDSIKDRVVALIQEVGQYTGYDQKAREVRFLDEMLTRCVLDLDDVQCGQSNDMRQQRKTIINLIDKATDILQRKVKLNLDMHELNESVNIHLSKQVKQEIHH